MIAPLRPAAPPVRVPRERAPAAPSPGELGAEEAALALRDRAFDLLAVTNAENLREANVLRDMAFEQLKKDDEYARKWITLI